jgi:hypothetical protein
MSHEGMKQDLNRSLELCRGQGQRINGLIPVEAEENGDTPQTVYCDKGLKKWFYKHEMP